MTSCSMVEFHIEALRRGVRTPQSYLARAKARGIVTVKGRGNRARIYFNEAKAREATAVKTRLENFICY